MLRKLFRLSLLLFVLLISFAGEGKASKERLVKQKIVYTTSQAGAVYLVWGVDNWVVPKRTYLPADTELRHGFAYTKMQRTKNTFFTTISLPAATRLNFSFWVLQNRHGKEVDGWDNYGGMNYNSLFTGNKTIPINDFALTFSQQRFNILAYGWLLLLLALGLLVPIYLALRVYFRPSLVFRVSFMVGLAGAVAFICGLVRLQLNDYLLTSKIFTVLGALFHDLLWLGVISTVGFALLFLTQRIVLLYRMISVIFIFLLLLTVFIALANTEVVKQLGAPINYQWLYYSDFMNALDAKNAVAKVLSLQLIMNFIFIILSFIIIGIINAVGLEYLQKDSGHQKRWVAVLLAAGLIVGLVSYRQYRTIPYDRGKITNPALVFIRSALTAESTVQLFSLPVPEHTRQYIQTTHNQNYKVPIGGENTINNVVVFVLESTPAHFVSLYDSTYKVTPNLQKWKNISQVYTNIYAHIPSTANSMLSLVSGIYPLISYRSAVNDYPQLAVPSLPGLLKNNNWTTSLFFSSDLLYSNMADYARYQQFEQVEDYKNIACSYQKFKLTNTALDGLDDRCLVKRYLQWTDTYTQWSRFSVLWTNQTHYPYFTNQKQVNYDTRNEDLNRYLNALTQSDAAFGLLMSGLEQRKMLEQTLVLVVGDHGEAFGSHKQKTHASRIYEENVHIPLIIFNPVLFKGTTDNRIGGMVDIPPTISHILGLNKPQQWQGTSLLTKHYKGRTYFISPYSEFLFGTRHQEWKYIYNGVTNFSELYNLKNDPKELVNVAQQHPEIVKQEFEMLAAWIQYHNQKISKWLLTNKEMKLAAY